MQRAVASPDVQTRPDGATTVDDLVDRLRAAGVRITAPRQAVVTALVALGSHCTAEDLERQVGADHPEVSTSSVYRTLDVLTRHGIVRHVHLGHGPAQYHLTDDRHAHLVCRGCGAVVELDDEVTGPIAADVEDATGYRLDLDHFALQGWCPGCAPS